MEELKFAIDTMWVLIAAALVFFMQAGFAMVETGFTRSKNAGNIIMKNHKKIPICKHTGKASYSSEAKAIRAVNNYDSIKRAYFCEHCDGFHITSETIEQTLGRNVLDPEEENRLLKLKIDKMAKDGVRLDKPTIDAIGQAEARHSRSGRVALWVIALTAIAAVWTLF